MHDEIATKDETVIGTNGLMDINGKIYQLVKIIEFIWSQYTSLTHWVVMSKNMKVAPDIDHDKLKNLHTNFWSNSWIFLSAWQDDSKSTNMVAVVRQLNP